MQLWIWIDIFQSLYDHNTHLLPLPWSQLIFEQDMTNLKLLTRFQPTFHRVHCCTTNLSSPLKPKTLLVGRGRDFQHAVSHTQPCPAAPKATQCHFGEGLANWIANKVFEGGFLEYTFEKLFCNSGPSWVHSRSNLGRCCWSLLVVAVKFRNSNWRKKLFTPMKFWLPFHLIQNGTHFKKWSFHSAVFVTPPASPGTSLRPSKLPVEWNRRRVGGPVSALGVSKAVNIRSWSLKLVLRKNTGKDSCLFWGVGLDLVFYWRFHYLT